MSGAGTWRPQRQSLRRMIDERDGRLLVAIGVGSGADARLLHSVVHELAAAGEVPDFIGGFITFVSGFLCAAAHGLPDLGLVLRHEIVAQTDLIEQATWLAAQADGRPALPIGVDIDTGYGDEPAAVLLTCRQVHKQGAQYVQIEDQLSINKSCGHLAGARGQGKSLLDCEAMIARRLTPAVRFAAEQDDLCVMARTDAAAPLGIDEAINRAQRYAEAGATMVFVEAPEGDVELRRVADALAGSPALNTANLIEGSPHTPYQSPRQLHDMGFDLALYCVGSLLGAATFKAQYFAALGRGEPGLAEPAAATWFTDFKRQIGVEQLEAWSRLFAGE